jgi:hypothetical protein
VSGPIVFISHSRVKEGKADGFRDFFLASARSLEMDKPGTVVFLAFANEDRTDADIVHVFPDADAMDRHLEGVGERAEEAFQFIETAGYEIYGSPSEGTLETMRGFASSLGVPMTVRPELVGGYVRPGSG